MYVLIEFQRKCEDWMAVRAQVYQGLLWQQVIDEHKKTSVRRLPPLLMLVLYTGDRRWKAAETTGELVAISPDSTLWRWQPHARYHILDVGAFRKEELARRSGLVPLLFRLEQRQSSGEFAKVVREVRRWFLRHAGNERLEGLFVEVIRRAGVACGLKRSEFDNLLEKESMLVTSFRDWKAQWHAEGKAEALICILTKKFGELDRSRKKQIREAKLATLDRWINRAIDSSDLASVFKPARRVNETSR